MTAVMAFLAELIRALLPALVDLWKRENRPTLEESATPRDLKHRLKGEVLKKWGGARLRTALLLLLVCLAISGCGGTRTILVPQGDPVRLRETVPKAKVWVLDKDGIPTAGVTDLPEGWYCLPVPEEKEGK